MEDPARFAAQLVSGRRAPKEQFSKATTGAALAASALASGASWSFDSHSFV